MQEKPQKKVRSSFDDCLLVGQSWDTADARIEQSYRRGLCQGWWFAVMALRDGYTIEDLERFHLDRLRPWRFQRRMKCECPPELRKKGGAA